jgi:hypothetical protein
MSRTVRSLALGLLLVLAAAVPAVAAQWTAARGAVSATVTDAGGASPLAFGDVALTITRAGAATTFDGIGSDGGTFVYRAMRPRPLVLRDLDGDGEPEALVTLYSGGAHCCTRSAIASWDGSAYRLSTHGWADAGWALRDLGRDGTIELVSWDPRWAYWSVPYFASARPLQVWRWSTARGRLVDVTTHFRRAILADMRAQWRGIHRLRAEGAPTRGAVAAFVADGYLARRPGAAWRRAYAAYRRPDRLRFFRALRGELVRLGYRRAGSHVPPVRPLR